MQGSAQPVSSLSSRDTSRSSRFRARPDRGGEGRRHHVRPRLPDSRLAHRSELLERTFPAQPLAGRFAATLAAFVIRFIVAAFPRRAAKTVTAKTATSPPRARDGGAFRRRRRHRRADRLSDRHARRSSARPARRNGSIISASRSCSMSCSAGASTSSSASPACSISAMSPFTPSAPTPTPCSRRHGAGPSGSACPSPGRWPRSGASRSACRCCGCAATISPSSRSRSARSSASF